MRCRHPRFLTTVSALLLAAVTTQAGERRILRLYTWSDFFAPDLVGAFEAEYGCLVAIDIFDSNEAMLESLHDREADHAYDLITPSSYMAAIMRKRSLIRDLDHTLLPNLGNIDPAFLRLVPDPESVYSVPYTRTVTGVGYNRGTIGQVEPSWAVFADPRIAGRATMLDDMRESLGAALKYLGYSLNTTVPGQIREAATLLRTWRNNLAKFEVDQGNYGLGSGEYDVVHGYNGDLALLMEENPEIDFFVPEEGSAVTSDDFVIPTDAANPELAHAFINFFLAPEHAAVNMAEILYYMPIPAAHAMLDDRLRGNHAFSVPEAVLDKCEIILDLGEATAMYEEAWAEAKGAGEQ